MNLGVGSIGNKRTKLRLWKKFALSMGLMCALMGATGCSSTRAARQHPVEPRDAAYDRVMASAQAAWRRGDAARAAVLYEEALNRAQVMDRSAEIGSAGYNLAICRIAMGDYEGARGLLEESRRELQRVGENTVDTWLASAEAAWRAEAYEEAWAMTDGALHAVSGKKAPDVLLQAYSLRALVALREHRLPEAETALAAAKAAATRGTPPLLRARLAEAKGAWHTLAGEPALAAQFHDQEADLYRSAARYYDMAMALSRASLAYAADGEPEAAVDRAWRGARSLAAAGYTVEALQLMEARLPELEGIESEETARRIAAWLMSVKEKVNQPPETDVKEGLEGEES